MSLSLQKQNKMLKDYVAALQNQNRSRNREKDILLFQIQNLGRENSRIKSEMERVGRESDQERVDELIRSRKQAESQVMDIKNHLETALDVQASMQLEIVRLNKELEKVSNQGQVPTSKQQQSTRDQQLLIQKLTQEAQQLRDKYTEYQKTELELSNLRKENAQYQLDLKIENQKRNLVERLYQQQEMKMKEGISSVREELQKEFEIQKEEIVNELNSQHENIKQAQQNTIKQLQNKIKELQTKLYKIQVNTSSELRQLKSLKTESEGRIEFIEKEKQNVEKQKQRLLHRIQQLQLEVSNKNHLLASKNTDGAVTSKNKNQGVKKKQLITQSCPTIEGVKQSGIRSKSGSIDINTEHVSTQVEQENILKAGKDNQELKNMEEKYKRQIDQLKMKLGEIEKRTPKIGEQDRKGLVGGEKQKQKQNEGLKKVIMELTQNSKSLLDRLKIFQQPQQSSHQLHDKIDQKPAYPHHHSPQPDPRNQQDLRQLIKSLKTQLTKMTSDFRRMQDENKRMRDVLNTKTFQVSSMKQINNSQFQQQYRKNYEGVEEKRKGGGGDGGYQRPLYNSQMGRGYERMEENQEQYRVRNAKMRNPVEKFRSGVANAEESKLTKSHNRDKWQNLQRRIRELREENNQLKQTLSS